MRAIFGEIGKQVHVHVERNHRRFVAFAQNAVQESSGGFLFRRQAVLFAAARVNQQSQCNGERFFRGEKGDLLFLVILKNAEVFLFERRDNLLFLIAYSGENVDKANFGLDGGSLLIALLGGLLRGLLRGLLSRLLRARRSS